MLHVERGTYFFFKEEFHCMGVDISERILEIAKEECTYVEFKKANMIDMRLEKKSIF